MLDKAKVVGEQLSQGKNDYKSGGLFYGLFLAPNIKFCLTIEKHGNKQEHKAFKGFNDIKRLLDRSQYFKMIESGRTALLPTSCKKLFNGGIIIPTKMRFCIECYHKRMCDKCKNQVDENKEFEVNFNFFKRKAANEFGYMLPYFKE